jgi:threonine aldolase
LRSDTVTAPSRHMLEAALTAPTGDDVLGEDPTVQKLQEYMADLLGKEKALFVPSGTMANLVAIMAHCHTNRSSEMIIGQNSHISLWEAGNAASLAGVYTRPLPEDVLSAELQVTDVRDACNRSDTDDHVCKTELLCLENTHNILGGAALPLSHMREMGNLCQQELGIKLHVDGARIFNASVALNVSVHDLCAPADSVAICLSKGLGAPLGSVLVGESEFIRLAKRARKRCGGGMRQVNMTTTTL